MTWTELITPPEPDELEVSLFGPGFGECVVVHLGYGDWIIVDSCVGPDGKTPAGVDYLKRIGVEPTTAVKCVVATHWHNDHVRGLALTMKECSGAKFVCSQAIFSPEFIALTDLWKRQRLTASPVSELTGVLDTITSSNTALKGSTGDCRIRFASANRCLWRRPKASEDTTDTSAELHSLSPSDAAIRRSLELIAASFPTGETLAKPVASHPNQFSVVLWINVAGVRCLLGADMEEQDNPYGGWNIIVESPERPPGAASLFKIPHHGSITGSCESVWTRMLIDDPVALLAPFQLGQVRLSTPEDTNRIGARTVNAFITATLRDRAIRGRTASVHRTIRETVRYIRLANDSFGHVRARRRLQPESANWSVATFGAALPLSEFYEPR